MKGMNTIKRKVGRKPQNYVTSSNETINGLMRQPDGRWKIIATGQRFTEPDENLAIAHFYRLTGQGLARLNGYVVMHAGDENWPEFDSATSVRITCYNEDQQWAEVNVPEAFIWAHVRKELLRNPIYVAERVGIEQLGYLSKLDVPEKVPSLDDIEAAWKDHAKCAVEQVRKVLRGWQDFRKTTKITKIEDVTPSVVVAYQDDVHGRNLSGKQQQHIFNSIRRIISFAKGRAMAITVMAKVHSFLSILKPSESATTLDPKPIEIAEFNAILAKATGEDRAMILLMLNAALYIKEAIRLEWIDIKDGCLVTRRMKTGECIRVAVLWPETLEALAQVQRVGPHIFRNYTGKRLGISGAQMRFNNLTDLACVPHVTASQLRDGSYTACVQANVTSDLCKLLVGHRSGMADHYVQRNPKMVAPACEAIYQHYFATEAKPMQLAIAG
jgi:integrase